jgi:hypothetical protein
MNTVALTYLDGQLSDVVNIPDLINDGYDAMD